MYTVIFDEKADKDFRKLPREIQEKITKAIREKLNIHADIYLIPLVGDKTGMYKFRVGEYRLLCKRDGDKLVITVLKVKHRKDVYR